MPWYRSFACVLVVVALVGCEPTEAQFRLNEAYIDKQERELGTEFTEEQKEDFATVLASLFGTPDEPFVPTSGEPAMTEIVKPSRLRMAAGPVGRDEDGTVRGLYREHCVHCHGITGDGAGPTASFLNPYSRDYRMGVFKSKATPIGAPPTHEDLRNILINGIPGTAMPSFKLLPDNEIDALVDYVKYLAIRGQVERRLIFDAADEFGSPEDRLDTSSEYLVDDVLSEVVGAWRDAELQVPTINARPEWDEQEMAESIEKGRELFYGAVANCFSCHGQTQLGDGQRGNYDKWTADFFDFEKELDLEKREEMANRFQSITGLEARPMTPRNLRSGVYRFGRRPVDLYLRILHGIDGTPMPAASVLTEQDPVTAKKLSEEDIWHLVDYIQSLPYEAQIGTAVHEPTYQRERL